MTRFSPVLVVWCLLAAAQGLTVQVPGLGSVQGTSSLTAWTGRTVYEFRGLRYAQPPSGERRFKEPVKETAWTGVRDATEYGQACPQPDAQSSLRSVLAWLQPDPEVASMQRRAALRANDPEDCLTLDVHIPDIDVSSSKLPVLVYFHGGAFVFGTSAWHRPSYLLEKDIVLVTPQYRLGALGFFHLNTVDAPGNAGLADQLMALQWVRDNIAAFGGDPQKVTIGGISAGAASVSLHMLSPRSRGLFHRVITQSGSALDVWAMDESDGEFHSRQVSTLAGCDGARLPPSQLAACMRSRPLNDVIDALMTHSALDRLDGKLGMGAMMPTLQRAAEGVTPFISKMPTSTVEEGDYEQLPLVMGVSRHEGIYFLDYIYQFFLVPLNYLKDDDFLRHDFISSMLQGMCNVEDPAWVMADAVTSLYFRDEDLGNFTAMLPGLVDFTGTVLLKGPTLRQTELHAPRAPTFLYSFDYQGSQTLTNIAEGALPVPGGITHGDDTMYVFPRSLNPLDAKDTIVAKRMVDMFTNFVITGNPSLVEGPVWPAYDGSKGEYLSVGSTLRLATNFSDTFTAARVEGLV